MSNILIKNAKVIAANEVLEQHCVYCVNGKIEKVVPCSQIQNINADEIIDASGMYIAPGYIDMHIHGIKEKLAENGKQDLEGMCKVLPQYGVTAFLPAICPKPYEQDDLKLIKQLAQVKSEGACLLGFFLEGHYLALTGAISNIPKNKSCKRVEQLIEASSPYKLVFAISPEIEGITQLLPHMTKQGYPAFITHTAATFEQTQQAIEAGAVHATHFYNVFPYIGDKEPGVRGCGAVEAILANAHVSVDFILDGEHVDVGVVKMALNCKAGQKVCLITDANVNAGMPPGRYKGLGDSEIDVSYYGGPARMAENTSYPGTLAGSGLTMDKAVKNAVKLLGVDIPQAVAMASSNPARVLGIQDRKGFIQQGYDADMVLLDDKLNVVACWVEGKCCFKK